MSRLTAGPWLWCWVGLLAVACLGLRGEVAWLASYPDTWTVPFADWINQAMDWFVSAAKPAFQSMSDGLSWPMEALRSALHWLPWPATCGVFAVMAHAAGGWRLSVFTVVALGYMVVTGYWDESVNTLALVGIAVPLAIGLGFALSLLAYRYEPANRAVQVMLDLMQTVPTFAYLIPILLLFGFGPVVGLIASAIYACPPMVRNTILGLRRVPPEVIEAAQMAGANRWQLFWWARFPSALNTIMVGVNQTIMAALSMVIIAAIIGGFADIGWEVLSTMRKAQFGQSLLAGLVIALMAMLMDRISRGLAMNGGAQAMAGQSALAWHERHRYWLVAAMVAVAGVALGQLAPFAQAWPEAWRFYPAAPINDALLYVTANYSEITESLKRAVLFYFLLPIRIGLENSVKPFTWGMELTPAMTYGYAIGATVLSAVLAWRGSWRLAVASAVVLGFLYFGVTRMPWPVAVAVVCAAAWQCGGPRVLALAAGATAFLLAGGVWPQAMLSVYLCGAAVFICALLGGSLGVLAAHSDRVSGVLRPINDTLQTMPLFVFLIPVLMFFQIGEFTALLAVVAYAVVPAIRYTEHGLRNVDPQAVEAARSMGCTNRQILWQVKLPLALPEIMLGLNQTVMFALAMLVIAALVGTKGLGQSVYIALGKADPGLGAVAGLGMALIAIVTDRVLQGAAARQRARLGGA